MSAGIMRLVELPGARTTGKTAGGENPPPEEELLHAGGDIDEQCC